MNIIDVIEKNIRRKYMKPICPMCNRRLTRFKNGDWEKRVYHKKCWIEKENMKKFKEHIKNGNY